MCLKSCRQKRAELTTVRVQNCLGLPLIVTDRVSLLEIHYEEIQLQNKSFFFRFSFAVSIYLSATVAKINK